MSAHAPPPLDRPQWAEEGRDWPNSAYSRFVDAANLRWHVQVLGSGPVILLIHGTGAATHSWRSLAPMLAEYFTVVAPDLPGHGFTSEPAPDGYSLPAMSRALAGLLAKLGLQPALAIGHSAGAAIAARMSLDDALRLDALVSLNGALLPLRGIPGQIFAPVARLFASSSLVPRLFSWRAAEREVVERLVNGTGSRLDSEGVDLYRRLIRYPGHAAAALAMMANWDLSALARDLPRLAPHLVLVVGANDRTVPPREAWRVRALLPQANLISLQGLGHLAHEEQPQAVVEILMKVPEFEHARAAA